MVAFPRRDRRHSCVADVFAHLDFIIPHGGFLARIQLPQLTEMSPEQRSAYDEAVAGPRGYAPAPMNAWIQNPEFARKSQKLGEVVRFQLSLPARLRELAVLVVVRHWAAHYEWRIHKTEGVRQGLSAQVVEAITARRRPEFENDTDRVAYDIAVSIMETRAVPEALYREGVRVLGEQGLVELVGVIGYYTYVSITLNTFEIGLPEVRQPELLDK
jgi:4-carboxymuconolactone decarboxylase